MKLKLCVLILLGLGLAVTHAAKQSPTNPDFTAGGKLPDRPWDWNLGPTGARGWMFANKGSTKDSRQILITKVHPGSPADGILEKDDVILGVGRKPFAGDARITFARSITIVEARDGRLPLIRWRNGRQEQVVLQLRPMGTYSPTAPWRCKKSDKILTLGCEALAARMKKDDKRGNPIIRSLNALALLASGNPEYMPLVKQEVDWAATYTINERSMHSWYSSWVTLLLAEYIMATKDQSVLPATERLSRAIAEGQSAVGTWGHRFAYPHNNILRGYGAMNQPGLALAISLVVAREAGVKDPKVDHAIEQSRNYLRFYVGKGAIPYGDHHPWLKTHDDNGKCSAGAILFDLLRDDAAASFYSRMATASYGTERETGHTGNFFNMLWSLPGVARSGPYAGGAWIRESAWMLDLARTWDHAFTYLGIPAGHDKYRNWDCTGAYLLGYAMAAGKLRFTSSRKDLWLDAKAAEQVIYDGSGWTSHDRARSYEQRSLKELFQGLTGWSPVVRRRAATTLKKHEMDSVPLLVKLLASSKLEARLGACEALEELGPQAAEAAPALISRLESNHPWEQVQAAEALAAIGTPAHEAIPRLLDLVSAGPTPTDPRGMVQRFVGFSLFHKGGALKGRGFFHRSLDGADRSDILNAAAALMKNEDGRVRGAAGSVYRFLTDEELDRMLPAIYESVAHQAPSGVMFADGIRMQGLELMARHSIAEGVPLCLQILEPDRWGQDNRFKGCMKALRIYGSAAQSQLPALKDLEESAKLKKSKQSKWLKDIQQTIQAIETDTSSKSLRSFKK